MRITVDPSPQRRLSAIDVRLVRSWHGMALRQTSGFIERTLLLIGLNHDMPDFSTLSRRQKTLDVNITHRGWQCRLHILIKNKGIMVEGESECNARPSKFRNNALSGQKST